MEELLARIGLLLYWIGSALAALCLLLTLGLALFAGWTGDEAMIFLIVGLGLAGLSWLAGRAARYLFAGR